MHFRSQCTRTHKLGLRVTIPPVQWYLFLVSVVCCQVDISATGRSHIQRSSNTFVCLQPTGIIYTRFVSYLVERRGGRYFRIIFSPWVISLLLSPHINNLLCNLLATQHSTIPNVQLAIHTSLQYLPEHAERDPDTDLPKDTRPAI